MTEADPNDDTIRRWVIHHYRFDPARNERRYVVAAAYDDEREYLRELERYDVRIRSEIAAGTRSDREMVSGTTWEPVHLAAQKRGHAVRRAIEHGVDPEPLLRDGPLPSNMAVLTFSEDASPPTPPG